MSSMLKSYLHAAANDDQRPNCLKFRPKKTQTNDAGQYVVPDLNIGHYNIKAESTRFKAAEQTDVMLQVGDRDRVDFHMQVG
jgi:carboxypeptidase family protein